MKLKELFKDYRGGMSQFQDDYFVTIQTGITPYGQYIQALRELYSRFSGLKHLWIELRESKILIEEYEYKISQLSDSIKDKFKREKLRLKLEGKIMRIDELERRIVESKVEFDRFYRQAVYLKDNYIGELTKEKSEQLEREFWMHKLLEYVHFDQTINGSISLSTYQILTSFPPEMKREAIEKIRNKDKLAQWYADLDKTATLPEEELEKIPTIDQERLLSMPTLFLEYGN